MNRSLRASLLALARPYPWVVPALVVLGLLASLAEGIGIGLLIPVLDDVIGGGDAGAASGPLAAQLQALTDWIPPDQRLWVLGTMIAVLVALKTVLMIANSGVSVWVSSRLGHDLRVRLGKVMLHADYAYVTRLEQGRVVNLFENQSDRAAVAMTLFANFVSAASTVLVFGLLLALLSWQLALVVLAVVLPVSLFVRSMTRSANRLGTKLVDACAVLTSRVLEMVGSVRTIRLFGSEDAKGTAFAQASNGVRRAEFRANLMTGSIQPLVEFLYVPVFFAVLALALRAGIGQDRIFLACGGHFTGPEMAFADAARIGGDIFKWDEFISQCVAKVMKLYALHNVVFLNDPDNGILRPKFNSYDQALSRLSFVSLLGLPLTLGDNP